MAPAKQQAPIDRYVVLEYLAEGGMGAIYLGKKLGAGGFEKQVVLKQLLPEFTRQPEFIDLFLREARLSATLDHANIIHTIDLVTAGEEHFIVMEYLDGADLRSLLKRSKARRRPMSAAAAIYVARELLSALAYAHNKRGQDGKPLRLIHRDISPSNILISANGEVKLTDFGIAKAATHNSVFYRVKGKVGYMSPEQARSEPLDARSDLYSLAVCLYEMITGERLLVAAGITTSADELYSKPVPLLSKKLPGLPAELDKVMLRALAVDPDHRYQTAAEFQDALLRCAHRNGLMMSAPELAQHLRETCGRPSQWRDEHEAVAASPGTEIYDQQEGTQQLDVGDEENGTFDVLALGGDLVSAQGKRRERAKTSLTNLGDLKGMELTSMAALGDDGGDGAEPLVDLDSFGAQAPAPRAPVAPPKSSSAPRFESTDPYASEVELLPRNDRAPSLLTGEVVKVGDPSKRAPSRADSYVETPPPQMHEGKRQRPLLILTLILLVGAGTAAAIGFTGPTLDTSLPAGGGAQE